MGVDPAPELLRRRLRVVGTLAGRRRSAGWLPALVTIPAPITMTYFLAFATGARPLERTMMQRPGYAEYAARTPMFFPLPPRTSPAKRR